MLKWAARQLRGLYSMDDEETSNGSSDSNIKPSDARRIFENVSGITLKGTRDRRSVVPRIIFRV